MLAHVATKRMQLTAPDTTAPACKCRLLNSPALRRKARAPARVATKLAKSASLKIAASFKKAKPQPPAPRRTLDDAGGGGGPRPDQITIQVMGVIRIWGQQMVAKAECDLVGRHCTWERCRGSGGLVWGLQEGAGRGGIRLCGGIRRGLGVGASG